MLWCCNYDFNGTLLEVLEDAIGNVIKLVREGEEREMVNLGSTLMPLWSLNVAFVVMDK